jgi:hypothetical protein
MQSLPIFSKDDIMWDGYSELTFLWELPQWESWFDFGVIMDEIVRQKNPQFIQMIHRVRLQEHTANDVAWIRYSLSLIICLFAPSSLSHRII